MSFVSWPYYLLLLLTAVAYYLAANGSQRKAVLVIASCFFVAFFHWVSFLFLGFISVVNFLLLQKISRITGKTQRKFIFRAAIGTNILVLLTYKVMLALQAFVGAAPASFWQQGSVILGLSFYGLQLIGYIYEVYQRELNFETPFSNFFLSIAFFPKIMEGPILKWGQFTDVQQTNPAQTWEENISYGVQRILLGLFKKVALADRLSPFVAEVFDTHASMNGLSIYMGAFLFTVQMYLDFSGFMDIALGSARILGVRLPENFNLPLRAVSIIDFWRRWHITLIEWLTSYVFYPISYRYRKLKAKGLFLAVAATFLISAAWHGLKLTFFVWGICHILYLVVEHRFFPKISADGHRRKKWQRILLVLVVLHLISFANIFFRAGSLQDALQLFGDMGRLPFLLPEGVFFKSWLLNGGRDMELEFNYRLSLFLCLLFLLFERSINRFAFSERYRIGYVAVALVLFVVFGYFSGGEQFVYNNF